MNNIKELKYSLKNNPVKCSWWGQRAHDALGLSYILDLDFLVCCDWGADTENIWGEKVVSLERLTKKRGNFSNEDLNFALSGELKHDILDRLSGGSACIMYRSLEELEGIASGNNKIKIFSASNNLKRTFDDKILFRKILKELGLNIIPGETVILQDSNYSSLMKKWGKEYMLRYPVASSGSRTFLVKNRDEHEMIKNNYVTDVPVIAEGYLPGYSLNINAVIGGNKIYLSPPSVQVIGVPCLISGRFGFAGNDFSSAKNIDGRIMEEIKYSTLKIAGYMLENGFKGMMGIDFIVYEGKLYPVEINPRFQNSTSLLTLLEIKEGKIPLVLRHLKQFDRLFDDIPDMDGFSCSFDGAQITLHNLEDKDITVINTVKPGVYYCEDGDIKYRKEGHSLLDCREDSDFVICCGVPEEGTILEPGSPLFKIHFCHGIMKNDLKTLKKEIELTIKKLYNAVVKEK
ncbi:ATP-grasp domain-containing protein [Elusimicrobiota bacterium]